jgi:hypothetical protein
MVNSINAEKIKAVSFNARKKWLHPENRIVLGQDSC